MVYRDDILILSESLDDHVMHFITLLARCREAGLMVKVKKCQLGQRKVEFLGHYILVRQISPL